MLLNRANLRKGSLSSKHLNSLFSELDAKQSCF